MKQSLSRTSGQKRVFFTCAFLIGVASLALGVFTATQVNADFKTVDGKEYRWQHLEGKWVVLNYFAKWCAPCLRELPELNRFADSVDEDVKLFGVNYDPMPTPEIQALIREFKIQFPVIPNEVDNKLPTQTPGYLPATFIIAPNGDVAATLFGEQTEKGLHQKIQALKSQSL
ncbi:TlpA family protein disulfide reductase [Alteromonas ponticola]|uniref:TlpA family protein disulfide reductase n=1 Tax=Alteromonas aquimaris TaxID=2998417 RepID=A0ABT3P7Q0_9ALTE|nr:TlpA disulfide reductase family protein [Alteromonas aquimaris]MCW8108121.1 TlpA family protein disulfide reductase [Alteromonas aquimaris]